MHGGTTINSPSGQNGPSGCPDGGGGINTTGGGGDAGGGDGGGKGGGDGGGGDGEGGGGKGGGDGEGDGGGGDGVGVVGGGGNAGSTVPHAMVSHEENAEIASANSSEITIFMMHSSPCGKAAPEASTSLVR